MSRRRTLVPLCVVLGGFVLVGIFGVLAAKLPKLERDDSAAFLPHNAESTQVIRELRMFQPQPTDAAVVVYVRDSGITVADRARVAADSRRFAAVHGVVGKPTAPAASADKKALSVTVSVAQKKQKDIAATVQKLRDIAATRNGLSAYVAGQAGLQADLADALKSVDLTLLFAAAAVVIIILVVVYRSPLLWIAPVSATLIGLGVTQGIIYLLARCAHLTIDQQSASILLVLGFGAGTDYALLLISRLREELRYTDDQHAAVQSALRSSWAAIVSSGLTVTVALLCLLMSSLQSNKTLGLTAAIAIVCCMMSALTFMPALLRLFGRRIFWPMAPRVGEPARSSGFWANVATGVGARPALAAVASVLALGILALGATQLKASGIAQAKAFLHPVDSTKAQKVLGAHYPAGLGGPAMIIADAPHAAAVTKAAGSVRGVDQVSAIGPTVGGARQIAATLNASPDGEAAIATVDRLRDAVHAVPGATVRVGGESAVYLDQQNAGTRDRDIVIPVVLVLIFGILVVLLRALAAPLILLATVVLSFLATLGVSALVFNHLFHFAGADPSYPLFVFVFLVALGVDYNIFLMARIREEAQHASTREATLRGLRLTGSVITSSGLVLAATFATLGVLPLVFFATVGFSVAFGVLLDTFLVRSVLVPAGILLIGERAWWPAGPPRAADPVTPQPALSGEPR